jgi:hypothetical protein
VAAPQRLGREWALPKMLPKLRNATTRGSLSACKKNDEATIVTNITAKAMAIRVALEWMVEYAHRRHWVEQYHEEAKGLLGWDQYQGRQWRGFHRHAASVMLAYSFLVWREWRQRPERARPGRPRRAFSPSAGPAAHVPAGGPSPGLRLAPARSSQGVAVA